MPPPLVVTGVGGGHDVDVRQLRADGAGVLGRLLAADGHRLWFADDAASLLATADAVHDDFVVTAEKEIAALELDVAPDERILAPRTPVPAVPELDLRSAGITSVVWGTGYGYDLGWMDAPVLDVTGAPRQRCDRGLRALLPGAALDALVPVRTDAGYRRRRRGAG